MMTFVLGVCLAHSQRGQTGSQGLASSASGPLRAITAIHSEVAALAGTKVGDSYDLPQISPSFGSKAPNDLDG